MGPTSRNCFFGLHPPPSSSVAGTGYELTEDDVLWTNDFSDPNSNSPPPAADSISRINHLDRRSSLPANSGILAALPEPNRLPLLYRRPSLPSSSSKSIPRPPGDNDLAGGPAAIRKAVNQSAPVRVPVLSAVATRERRSRYTEIEEDDVIGDGDDGGDEEMLPPHEIVARGSMMRSPRTTFSVLEGVGRTLKGRDLRQVRNAVWRQTGFLD